MSIFSSVLVKKPERSLFNLTHERKFSCDWANLYPILCMECVPGDTIKVSTELLIRTAPLVAPVMHRVNVKVHYFFVPNRILWSSWEDFITGVDQTKSYAQSPESYFVNPVVPYVGVATATKAGRKALVDGSLADFLGFPTIRPTDVESGSDSEDARASVTVPLLPFAAYQKIYDDWYRNQNVEAPHMPEPLHDGNNATYGGINLLTMRKKMWEKDYFTSALPFAQRGDPVDIPFRVGDLSLKLKQSGTPSYFRPKDANEEWNSDTEVKVVGEHPSQEDVTTSYQMYGTDYRTVDGVDVENNLVGQVDVTGHTVVDGTGFVSGTINDLRIATRLQRWLEKNARVGGRYIEQLLAHFGIHSSDARLQRAEYLGGWSNPIVISDVEQTSSTVSSGDDASAQGNLAGKGTSYGSSKPVKCFCEEHGFLIAIMSILPRTSYQDQLSRMWTRESRYDYYFPEFAHLGEQEIKKSEVWFDTLVEHDGEDDRFAFQERYCEYKYIPSTVHGEFKNNLSFWHLGRQFNTQPALNKSFCESDPRTNIFAVEDESIVDHFYVDLINNISALRPMPKQAVPTL